MNNNQKSNQLKNILSKYKVPDIICPLCKAALISITLKAKPDSQHITYGWVCGCNEMTRGIYDQGRNTQPDDEQPKAEDVQDSEGAEPVL
jgi:hypothetical protein